MPAQEIQSIINYLDQQAELIGMKEVREAAKKFLMRKSFASGIVKRKRLPRGQKERIYAKQDGKCYQCHEPFSMREMEDSHLNPLAQGGTNDLNNRVLMCLKCNRGNSSKSLIQLSKEDGITILDRLQ